jgi:hypothetical protein
MLNKSILACLIVLQSACVGGFAAFTTTKESYYAPRGVEEPPVRGSTKAEILLRLGKPKREYTEGSREFWVYNNDLALRGLIPVLIVPIPLVIPVGMNQSFVEFENDHVVGFTIEQAKAYGFVCVLILFWCVPFMDGKMANDVISDRRPHSATDSK